MVKKTINNILNVLNGFMYRGCKLNASRFSPHSLFVHGIMQKVIGFNRRVPWPVHWTSVVKAPENIVCGTRAPGLSMGCYLDGRNGIIIGENVWVGPRVSIISMNHDLCNYNNYTKGKPVVIGKNSWLATNCIILPGVELGEHTIVAAGAVVTKSFPEGNQIIGGNPARIIKALGEYERTV